jgi:hypothetical protein
MLPLTGLGDIMNKATPFACPTCGAEYKVMRVEAPPQDDDSGDFGGGDSDYA